MTARESPNPTLLPGLKERSQDSHRTPLPDATHAALIQCLPDRLSPFLPQLRALFHVPEGFYYGLRRLGASREEGLLALRYLVDIGRVALPPITSIELFLTEACNLRCTYCFVENKKAGAAMTADTARKAIDFLIRESRAVGRLHVLFFGGEPMMEWETIREVVAHAEEVLPRVDKSVRFDMTTNGTLITPAHARFMADHGIHPLLSIDGDEDVHDRYRRGVGGRPTFRSVVEKIEILRVAGHFVGAKMTVMPDVGHLVHENVAELYRRGVRHFVIGHATGISAWTQETLSAFAQSITDLYVWWRSLPRSRRPGLNILTEVWRRKSNMRHVYGCRAGRHSIAVGPDGTIWPCSKMLGANGLNGILALGSLDAGFTNTETRLTLNGYLPPERPRCWSCPSVTQCLGGCYAVNYTTTGDPFRSGPECAHIVTLLRLEDSLRRAERRERAAATLNEEQFLR